MSITIREAEGFKKSKHKSDNLQEVLIAKFGNQLTEQELIEMEKSLLELTTILFETYLEKEEKLPQ